MAISKNDGLGYVQSWRDVTANRASGVTYYNTTGKPIQAVIQNSTSGSISVIVDGVSVSSSGATISGVVAFIIPPNASYSVTFTVSSLHYWCELR